MLNRPMMTYDIFSMRKPLNALFITSALRLSPVKLCCPKQSDVCAYSLDDLY